MTLQINICHRAVSGFISSLLWFINTRIKDENIEVANNSRAYTDIQSVGFVDVCLIPTGRDLTFLLLKLLRLFCITALTIIFFVEKSINKFV